MLGVGSLMNEKPIILDQQPALDRVCENCGSTLTGIYCSTCGQHDLPGGPTFLKVLEDAWEELFKVDGKIFKTITLLLTDPGKLTVEFFAGKRVKYITPLKLCLTMTALYLLVANIPAVKFNTAHGMNLQARSYVPSVSQTQAQSTLFVALATYVANLNLIFFCTLPFTIFVTATLFFKRRRSFLYHTVAMLHLWSGVFLVNALILITMVPISSALLIGPTSFFYTLFSFRKVYHATWLESVLKSGVFVCVDSVLGQSRHLHYGFAT